MPVVPPAGLPITCLKKPERGEHHQKPDSESVYASLFRETDVLSIGRDTMITAIILAGGASSRMGHPKALLTIGEKTFLQHIDSVLASARITRRVVVLGADDARIRPTLSWYSGTIATNEKWERGQLSSILTGLDSIESGECHGVLLWPVDRPLVSQALVVGLLQAFWSSHQEIIVPVFQGRRGHPVIFSSTLFSEFRSLSPDQGARELLRRHADKIHHLETDEEGVVLNIDTNEQYRRIPGAAVL
jgi:molybdenum cofactor cytidylyltransferase